jgi:hypothetical protein
MSILSTLALLSTALVARRPEPDRVEELELELEGLKAQLDSVREDALRWQALAESWRARYEAIGRVEQRLNQAASAAAAQQYAAMNAQMAAQNQMLGMQAFDGFCNCVPSRTQVWGANRS